MRLLIIDDEFAAREQSKNFLKEFFPEVIICGESDSVESAYKSIVQMKPDLILLDVDLPDGTAFDLLGMFTEINFTVIFITAYEKYALQAIKFSALDYLLKPYTSTEFVEAIRKAQNKNEETLSNVKLNTLLQNVQHNQQPSKIVLRTADSIHVISTNEIIRLQADGAYTTFYLLNQKNIVISKNLKECNSLLKDAGFIRTHQSHLVNSKHIVCFHKSDGGSLGMSDSTDVPVATRFKEKVIAQLELI